MAYSIELKEKALKLSDEIGNKAAGEALNLNVKTIAAWRLERSRRIKREQFGCSLRTRDGSTHTGKTPVSVPEGRGEVRLCLTSASAGLGASAPRKLPLYYIN